MGCICSKGVKEGSRVKKNKGSKKPVNSSEKDEVDNGGIKSPRRLMWTRSSRSTPRLWEEGDKCHSRRGQPQMCRVLSVRNGLDGSQVVAGWPSWLASVAGEAIRGLIPRKTESFEKLDKIGQGTYSSVYRARDLETRKVVALKKVRFANMDPESVRFMAREILILRKLDHPNVMKLEGLVTSRVSGNLYLVFEYMEHDLAGLAASPVVRFTVPQIKCFMQQLLCGLEHCHNRGVLHRDIKGSNLLIDKNGNLKIGDFGLATLFQANQKQPLTSRVVTLWYRPPELLLGSTDYGVAVDLWSSGCILAELFVGKPIMPGKTEVEQLHKIFKLCGSPSEEYWKKSKLQHATIFKPQQPYKRRVSETFKDFHPSSLSLLESLLAFEPERRGSTTSALHSQFFTTMPLPCDPSSLPKYPPSKEYDVKALEEARRQNAAGKKGGGVDSSRKSFKESKSIMASDPNAEHPASTQKWKVQSEIFNRKGTGGPIFPSRGSLRIDNVGPSRNSLNSHSAMDSSGYREMRTQSLKPQAASTRMSQFSNSHGNSQLDFSRNSSIRWAQHKQVDDGGESSSHLLGKSEFPCKKKEGQVPPPLEENNNTGYAMKKTQMYSGPLLPSVETVEEMLKEHEKQIQLAVRKARDKNVTRKAQQIEYGRNGSILDPRICK